MIDYAAQTDFSDPAPYAALLAELPADPGAISAAVRNLIVHYRAGGVALPPDRAGEIDNRWVSRMLAVDQARHPGPVTVPRPAADRVGGCCRDFTLLAVAALRQHGIPARSRIGFGGYLDPDWHCDHVVVELMTPESRRPLGYRLLDAQLDPADFAIDVTDLPRSFDGFASAADVWTAYRRGEVDVDTFGVDRHLPYRGAWFVRNYVLLELAHRQGDEVLLWDGWGLMRVPAGVGADPSVPPADNRPAADFDSRISLDLVPGVADLPGGELEDDAINGIVDEIAALLVAADAGDAEAEAELAARYASDKRLPPGDVVTSYSPTGQTRRVSLATRVALPS